MKKPRFTEQQVAQALRQAEQGTSAAEVCRKLGVSEATFYAWKKRYAGMGIAELRRVRQLEEEIAGSNRWSRTSRWTSRCCRRCCKKRSKARAPTRDRARGHQRVSRERAAGLRRGRLPAGDVLLPRPATGRDAAADAAAGVGSGPAQLDRGRVAMGSTNFTGLPAAQA